MAAVDVAFWSVGDVVVMLRPSRLNAKKRVDEEGEKNESVRGGGGSYDFFRGEVDEERRREFIASSQIEVGEVEVDWEVDEFLVVLFGGKF